MCLISGMDDCPITVWCGGSAEMLKHRHPARSRALTSSGCVIDACIRKVRRGVRIDSGRAWDTYYGRNCDEIGC